MFLDDMIMKYEGCKLKSYKCPAGVWTIGYGTTYFPDGTPVKEGDEITKEFAEVLLCDYVQKNIVPVFDKIPYKLTDDQKIAIASLCYNVGVSAFIRSKLFTAICKKDYAEVCRNWDWYKANGKVMKGLIKRRVEELFYFVKGL